MKNLLRMSVMRKKIWIGLVTALALFILMTVAAFAGEIELNQKTESLRYDDRYSVADLIAEGYSFAGAENETVLSNQVSGGMDTGVKDTAVMTKVSDTEFVATATGSVDLRFVRNQETELIHINVQAAPLTVMYLTGQSNMEGNSSGYTGFEKEKSIVCEEGEIYSTYVSTSGADSRNISGISFAQDCVAANVSSFVTGALGYTENAKNLDGKKLEYPLNNLSAKGNGKTGMDSGLAYEWHRLTNDKVWVVNVAVGASPISSWIPGGWCYERAVALEKLVEQTCQAEVSAGHYTIADKFVFWLQGENNEYDTPESYVTNFQTMHDAVNEQIYPTAWGIISVRAACSTNRGAEDVYMTGPRIAQYGMGGSTQYSDVYMVSNANEQWTSDEGVYQYFSNSYANGILTYPVHSGASLAIPTTELAVHSDIHYGQIGHNENGITAADGMYGRTKQKKATGITFKNYENESVSKISVLVGQSETLVPVTTPVYAGKSVRYSVNTSVAEFNPLYGTVTGKEAGTVRIYAYDSTGIRIWVTVHVKSDADDYTWEAGKDYTGIYNDNGTLLYLENGRVQKGKTGLVYLQNQWYYVKGGKVDTSYTGFAFYADDWWYIEEGKLNFDVNSVIYGNAYGENAWWHVVESKVVLDTTVAPNEHGWWRIEDGKVNFNYNEVAPNEHGWWKISGGAVDFNFNGLAANEYGWWKISGGAVDFNFNDMAANEYGWWKISGGAVDFSFNGLAANEYGWWKISGGVVDFSFNGLAANEYGWWKVSDGAIDFNYHGLAKNEYGLWYVENGCIDFGYTGRFYSDRHWWNIINGYVRI